MMQLGKLIAGNTRFDKEVPHYLIIMSDMSAFYNEMHLSVIRFMRMAVFSVWLS